MGEIIRKPDPSAPEFINATEEHKNTKAHLMMLLEAMQYKGNTKFMGNDRLRELVEEQKIIFLRKMQREVEKEHLEKYGKPL